ncbi:hypothetical protein AAHA92_00972 [Salvia divinorum]|uniref:Uncharacterized protein n=1 Tax=Salvia divinorum TaxID=28513 RepID=A0ABD1IPI4_SALDI
MAARRRASKRKREMLTGDSSEEHKSAAFGGPIAFLVLFYVDRGVHCRRPFDHFFSTMKGWTGLLLKK